MSFETLISEVTIKLETVKAPAETVEGNCSESVNHYEY